MPDPSIATRDRRGGLIHKEEAGHSDLACLAETGIPFRANKLTAFFTGDETLCSVAPSPSNVGLYVYSHVKKKILPRSFKRSAQPCVVTQI